MQLFHFSDDPSIAIFEPRPVLIPSQRAAAMDWLNGPLVWAVDNEHDYLYLFPRECPRILVWATASSTPQDRDRWLRTARVVAYVEHEWLAQLKRENLTRYELNPVRFEDLGDAGMWVSRHAASVLDRVTMTNLPEALSQRGVTLRAVESLAPMKPLWETSLHVSGIRLRNARGWPMP